MIGGTMSVSKRMKEPPSLNLFFPDGGKVQPKGFSEVNMDDDVTIVIKGKVTSLANNPDAWDKGKRIGARISSCEILGPDKKTSFDKAIKKARKTV